MGGDINDGTESMDEGNSCNTSTKTKKHTIVRWNHQKDKKTSRPMRLRCGQRELGKKRVKIWE